ncbi:MAG: hypothetical protein E6Q06_00250 [Candidatus Moraniibacteriota bacterium]|nr:MAG: hypothetical protein E6Q06_00250 [Candidatus Moranbacteria bacterium]
MVRNHPVGFRLIDLAGSVPPDHRPPKPGATGPRSVRSQQIWVDRQTDELWEIVLISAGASSRKFLFTLELYGGYWDRKRRLSWSVLNNGFEVLENAVRSRKERILVLREMYMNAEAGTERSPDAASYVLSFGFDPETGFRIK